MNEIPETPMGPSGRMSLLDGIIRFCLENRLVVLLVVLLFVVWGLAAAPFDWTLDPLPRRPVPTDAIPDNGENQQIVFTRWMGRSPQDVDDQITYPLTVSLLGIPGVRTIRSISMFGFSSIYIIFKEEAEFYWSRSRALEKLNSLPANTLPKGVQPALGPDSTSLGQVFWYTLEGRDPDGNPVGGWDLHELRTVQDWHVRYALLSAEGISEVASVGGFVQEYQVDVDPDAMRAHGVTLDQIFSAVRMSNVDVGARTIEVNRVEYIIRGLGFLRSVSDLANSVITVRGNVPIYVRNVAHVTLGPALRRGALDKEGAEAVGGVVVVRYGFNPLEAIKNVKKKIEDRASGLPTKAVIDFQITTRAEVEEFAAGRDFEAYSGAGLNQDDWLKWLRETPREQWPGWINKSQVTVIPFYDRSGLIYETLGTLSSALTEEILVTIIVVIVSVLHLRSSLLISGALPLAVLVCFVAMKVFGVDANIVALSGIAIAIGTIVDMSIIVCENILRHLSEAGPEEDGLEVIFRATREVGGAVLTAVATTVISFLPVFVMTGAEGKLFKPLAFTKTFALVGSVIIALTIVPPGAYVLFTWRIRSNKVKKLFFGGLIAAGLVLGIASGWWLVGLVLAVFGAYYIAADYLPPSGRKIGPWVASAVAVALVVYQLTGHWEPLGPERGMVRNLIFAGGIIGGLLAFFSAFRLVYGPILRAFLAVKLPFLTATVLLVLFGGYVWLGPRFALGPINRAPVEAFAGPDEVETLVANGLIEKRARSLWWTDAATKMGADEFIPALRSAGMNKTEKLLADWDKGEKGNKQAQADAFDSQEDITALIYAGLLREDVTLLVWSSAALRLEPEECRTRLDELGVQNADRVFAYWSKARDRVKLRSKKW
ncbi:MAG: efflux RND transporter permease subunit, partial [Candidatus Brocadiia bacterium]|nr:efflux RND transporter permease subunit [Candidatus Brocadiia bacterium]